MAKRANGEGTIYRDGERWRAAVVAPDGWRVSKRFGNRSDASAWIASMATDIKRGDFVSKSDITVGQWIGDFLSVYVAPRVKPQTLARYVSTAAHVAPLGGVSLQEATAPQVQSLLNKLSLTLGGSSMLKVYTLLSSAFSKAVALGMVSKSIMDAVERPRYDQPEIQAFTRAEIAAILETLKSSKSYSRYLLFFQTAVLTGARLGELLALRRSAIGTNSIFIKTTLARVGGERIAAVPKTRAGRREITVSPALCRELKARAADGHVVELDPYVFHTASGKPYGERNVRAMWSAILKLAGLPPRHFHALRHTHATELLAAGVPILEVSKRLGHTKAGQTLNMYGHAIEGFDKKIPAIASDIFSL